jgi:N-acetyl-anhydromuramoyl-L-alanine amidase
MLKPAFPGIMGIKSGWLAQARQVCSTNCDVRSQGAVPELIVIHNISLPPGKFGGPWIDALFCNRLPADEDPYFSNISGLKVSSHLLIRRNGELVQYVPFDKRAWHAGHSEFSGRQGCNDFSIGIELEGSDTTPFSDAQYLQLAIVVQELLIHYPTLSAERIVGHSDIAPGRKTDPGPHFDWSRLHDALYP